MDRPEESKRPLTHRHRSAWTRLGGLVLAAALGSGAGFWWRGAPPTDQTPDAGVVVPLQVWLSSGRAVHALNMGWIALPHGSKFKLRVRSAFAGRLSIYAVDRGGRQAEAPLVTADVFAGKAVDSAELSMSGSPGTERLRVIVAPLEGGKPQVLEVTLWHFVADSAKAGDQLSCRTSINTVCVRYVTHARFTPKRAELGHTPGPN